MPEVIERIMQQSRLFNMLGVSEEAMAEIEMLFILCER